MGWDSPNRENDMTDSGFSQNAFGVHSLTGCSVWVEPLNGLSVVLLSNKIQNGRNDKKIKSLRTKLHKTITNSLIS
jgi:serine-type D-Ala-D-Ala carboxypeptidase